MPTRKRVVRRRDPVATRQRILDVAENEFAARGLAGARVHTIAKRADVNVRMLYHYFGDKEGLFCAVLQRSAAETPPMPSPGTQPFVDQWHEMLEYLIARPHLVRLAVWESLDYSEKPLVNERERRKRMRGAMGHLSAEAAAGQVDPELDGEMLLIAVLALANTPIAFAPMVRLITGLRPSSPAFRRRYEAFLSSLVERLAPEPADDRGRARTRPVPSPNA
jgi:TetR/AcrR family transcriptional regulator